MVAVVASAVGAATTYMRTDGNVYVTAVSSGSSSATGSLSAIGSFVGTSRGRSVANGTSPSEGYPKAAYRRRIAVTYGISM